VLTALKSDERTRDIPVIVVSGKSLSGTERLLLEAHTLSVWTKGSYNTHDLVEYIESELGQGTFAPGDVSPQGEESVWSTLLLIEDNPVDARLLRRQLEALGRIRILEAYSAQQALALLENERPAMIILDLMLPDQDGLSLLDSLRTDPNLQNVPIAVLTGKDLTEEERRRLEVNATHTWIKGQLPRLVLQREVIRAVEEKS
jgi:CheY-like chemotaxis protein